MCRIKSCWESNLQITQYRLDGETNPSTFLQGHMPHAHSACFLPWRYKKKLLKQQTFLWLIYSVMVWRTDAVFSYSHLFLTLYLSALGLCDTVQSENRAQRSPLSGHDPKVKSILTYSVNSVTRFRNYSPKKKQNNNINNKILIII